MKKVLFVVLGLMISFSTIAQMNRIESEILRTDLSISINDDLGDLSDRKRGRAGGVGISGAKQFIGAMMPIPLGDFADVSDGGFGFDLSPVFFFDRFGIGLLFGYQTFTFGDATYDGFLDRPYLIPFMLQGMYLFGEDKFLPYAGFAAGIYNHHDFGEAKEPFGFSPQAGVILALSEGFQLYFNARYNMFNMNLQVPDGNGGTVSQKFSRDYVSFTLGIGFPYTDPYYY